MAHKQTRHRSHVEFRHRSQIPLPAVEDVAQRRLDVRSPSWLAPRQRERRDPQPPERLIRLRQRLLTRPVIVALTVSVVWRRVPSIAAVQKLLAHEGLLGIAPLQVSPPAIIQRLEVRPAAVLGQLWGEVGARLQAQAPPAWPHPRWAPVREPCSRIAIVDGSTLAARRQKTQVLREHAGLVLGGTMLGRVEALSHRPWWPLSTDDAAAHDTRLVAAILAALPVGGLLVCDLGFCSFWWCDDCTASDRCCVTRRREKTAYRTVQALSSSPHDRDALIQVGQYRSNPCTDPLRRVAVWWPGTWSRDLTHVLEPHGLSARQVCERYRRRWRIEDALALTTRRLDWAYWWTGSTKAVQVQIDATRLVYAVLVTLCQQVAQALGEPLERISVEMVCRAFSHDSRTVQHGGSDALVAFRAEHAKLLGLVKRWRKPHRERQELEAIIWGDP